MGVFLMSRELQSLNQQNKLAIWAERVTACRNSGLKVKDWCKENGICEQTYYKWQKRIYELSQPKQEICFAEITPVQPVYLTAAVTVRIGGIEADIHSGADIATIETVLRVLKTC